MATSPTVSADPLHDDRRYLQLAGRHYENFPVGSWLLPRAARRHLHRIYAFARTADDLADELRDAQALAAFRRDFGRQLDGAQVGHEPRPAAPPVPLFRDLEATMRECQLERELFTDLLDAFAQDLEKTRYDDEAELLDYCRRSADPIGRLVLRVCGHRAPELDRLSDRICTALQLLNHLQDLGEDLRERDRIYFPLAELARFGVGEAQLREPRADAHVRAFVLHEARRLGAAFAAGWPLVDAVRGRLRWELRAILRGAAAVLACIRAADGDVLGGRVHLGKAVRVRSVLAGLCCRRAPVFVVPEP
ncbi:MAG TPA: squalene synthase HpnC [Planctomycetota bacterium]|nr:squalene synthase HpnC [Planctomycetota bacterium]